MNVRRGSVNDEIEIVLNSSNTRITSVISTATAKSMGLETGTPVVALIKGEWVILVSEPSGVKFAARNNLPGTVISVKTGTISAEVNLRLDGGEPMSAVISVAAINDLGLKAGDKITALIKAANVIVGVRL
jgi:molybdate transport system regulatory protein